MAWLGSPGALAPPRALLAEPAGYAAFAQRVIDDGWLADPWTDGLPRFEPQPLALEVARAAALARAAEQVAAACDELARLCAAEPQLLGFLGLSPWQQAMWWASAPHWHALARADVFELQGGGIAVCELNCDTPSGMAEAAVLGRLLAGERDANRYLLERWAKLVRRLLPAAFPGDRPPVAGLVWPTDQTEDLPMLLMWQQALEQSGWQVVRGSPFNLTLAADGRAALLGQPCDAIVRHYKTDWWGERLPIWRDEPPLPDAAPLATQLAVLMNAGWAGRTVTVNPLGAVLPQNKKAYALLWKVLRERPQDLTASSRQAIADHVPPTWRLQDLDLDELRRDQDQWVLKSDFGCEGDEVVLGSAVAPEVWRQALAQALPERWIGQKRFAAAEDGDGATTNHGVYLIGGEAAGLLARRSLGPTDRLARMAAVAIARE
jgi:glutathionylspermidine synthase